MYKFGYDPKQPVLICAGRELPDSKVAEYFHSKTSLINRNKREAFEQLKKGLYGDKRKTDQKVVREPGRLIRESFWIIHTSAHDGN